MRDLMVEALKNIKFVITKLEENYTGDQLEAALRIFNGNYDRFVL